MSGKPIYDAFISYSHAKDHAIAAALQAIVQKLGKPWHRRRALRLFRDDTSLSATPQLWPSIEQALGRSRFLILLVSPEAAASPWVGKEVAYWLEHNSADTVLIALTGGQLDWDDTAADFRWSEATPLPPLLMGHFSAEPRWIDLRPYSESASLRDLRFSELCADFAAAIHGVPKEDLLSQEVRQQRHALRLAWSAASVLVALLATAGWLWSVAEGQKVQLRAERDRAEQGLALATDTIYGLARNFRNVNGLPVGIVDETIPRLRKLLDQLSTGDEASPELRWRESAALVETAETLLELRDTFDALDAVTKARGLMQVLTAAYPANADYQRSLAISLNKLGDVEKAQGDVAAAIAAYRQAAGTWEALTQKEPGNAQWPDDLAHDEDDLGDVLLVHGDVAAALAAYRDGLALRTALVARNSTNAEWQGDLATSDEKIGDALKAKGDLAAAIISYRAGLAIRQALVSRDPRDPQRRHELARSEDELGDTLKAQENFPAALAAYEDGFKVWSALAIGDPTNTLWQSGLFLGYERVGGMKKALGDLLGAATAFSQGLDVAKTLLHGNSTYYEWQIDLAVAQARMGTLWAPKENFAAALAILKRLDVAGLLSTEEKHWIVELTAASQSPLSR